MVVCAGTGCVQGNAVLAHSQHRLVPCTEAAVGCRPSVAEFERSSPDVQKSNKFLWWTDSGNKDASQQSSKQDASQQNGHAADEDSSSEPSKPARDDKRVGQHNFWKRGPLDHVRSYLLSISFQAGVQSATGAHVLEHSSKGACLSKGCTAGAGRISRQSQLQGSTMTLGMKVRQGFACKACMATA